MMWDTLYIAFNKGTMSPPSPPGMSKKGYKPKTSLFLYAPDSFN